jgi:hypothetical protein
VSILSGQTPTTEEILSTDASCYCFTIYLGGGGGGGWVSEVSYENSSVIVFLAEIRME